MATVLNPFGYVPVWHPSGEIRSTGYRSTGSNDVLIPSGTNVNFFKGQPVRLLIGTGAAINGVTIPTGAMVLAPVTATGQASIGVFAGVEFFDATNKPTVLNFWPANQTLFAGAAQTVYVWDDVEIIYRSQMDGAPSVGAGAFLAGKQVNVSTLATASVTNGSTLTGLSAGGISQTIVATGAQGLFRVIKVFDPATNLSSDAFPIFELKVANHQFLNPQTSL
jgi:hypothetical protein